MTGQTWLADKIHPGLHGRAVKHDEHRETGSRSVFTDNQVFLPREHWSAG